MATLERIVRPVSSAPFSPAMPPQPTPVGGESDPVIIGGDGNLTPIQLHHTVTVTINEYEESYETKRKVDTVRVKNPDDHSQHVDFDVMKQVEYKNTVEGSRQQINFSPFEAGEDSEILRTDVTRESNLGV